MRQQTSRHSAVIPNPRDYNKWLNRFALITCIATLLLICSGGMVTSKNVGLAVPDWPTTFGYNMFLFPISKWVGGILFEHTHRLMGSLVGFLTIILAVWLWLSDNRRWVRNLGVIAVVGVILQGILGGLRVTMMKDQIGIFHACVAQAFLGLIRASVGRPWPIGSATFNNFGTACRRARGRASNDSDASFITSIRPKAALHSIAEEQAAAGNDGDAGICRETA